VTGRRLPVRSCTALAKIGRPVTYIFSNQFLRRKIPEEATDPLRTANSGHGTLSGERSGNIPLAMSNYLPELPCPAAQAENWTDTRKPIGISC
jgi:hypothetical protein